MFKGNPDNIVLGQIGSNRGHTLANKVRLVGFVSVRAHSVFMRVDGHGRHGKLVGSTEDTDGNLSSVSHKELFERARVAGLSLSEASDAVAKGSRLATKWITELTLVETYVWGIAGVPGALGVPGREVSMPRWETQASICWWIGGA